MKILYLTFYFEPDLCAGSFRNTPIVKELSDRQELENGVIDVLTTMPNRYSTYKVEARQNEKVNNINIHRIPLTSHTSGFFDQIRAFSKYFLQTLKITRSNEYDLVFASSSRLFTAFLGAWIARGKGIPLFLDIRDLFRDTITDIFDNKIVSFGLNQILKVVENYTFGYASHINLVSMGFQSYFNKHKMATYSYHTNGIDETFLSVDQSEISPSTKKSEKYTILYAGNIGLGQGLHHIIPQVATQLEGKYEIVIIGDGGARQSLEEQINLSGVKNVQLLSPMSRKKLIERYLSADFLFVHLNDLTAFEKVLPSKIFEYAAFNKPVIAGLNGYALSFVKENLDNVILFQPCDVQGMVENLLKYKYENTNRKEFKNKFSRKSIIIKLVNDILLTAKVEK